MLRPAAARGSGAARHWDAARASSPRYGAAACGRFSAAPRSSSASSRTSSVKGAQQQSFSTSGVLHSVQRRLFQAPWVGSSREVEARPAPTRPHLPSDAATQQQRQWLDDVQQRMRAFLGPAILIPLADPLMALMDTLFVGQFVGTLELAAMGPANMLISFLLYSSRALPVAVMGLVASQLRLQPQHHHRQHHQHQQQQRPRQAHSATPPGPGQNAAGPTDADAGAASAPAGRAVASRLLGGGLLMALAAGCLGAGALAWGSEALVVAVGVQEPSLLQPAARYLRIRALALPAVLLTMVAQSGKLAQQDSLTPCLSVAVMVAASLVANVVLVALMGLGLEGAALSTVAVQVLGAAVLLTLISKDAGGNSTNVKPSWRVRRAEVRALLGRMAPLTLLFTAKNLAYLCVSVSAAALSTAALAVHNATYSLWVLLTWALSPVEQASMAFLPAATQRWQQRALSAHVLRLGVGVAAAAGAVLAAVLVLGPGLVLKDPMVQPLMACLAPQATLALCLAGADMAATAVNISLGDAPYVAASYLVTLAATAAYFAVCRQQGWGLGGVWWGLVLFFGVRAAQSTGRVAVTTLLVPPPAALVPAPVRAAAAAVAGVGDAAVEGTVRVEEAAGRLQAAAQQAQQAQQQQQQQQVEVAEEGTGAARPTQGGEQGSPASPGPAPAVLQRLQQQQEIRAFGDYAGGGVGGGGNGRGPAQQQGQQQQQQQQEQQGVNSAVVGGPRAASPPPAAAASEAGRSFAMSNK